MTILLHCGYPVDAYRGPLAALYSPVPSIVKYKLINAYRREDFETLFMLQVRKRSNFKGQSKGLAVE